MARGAGIPQDNQVPVARDPGDRYQRVNAPVEAFGGGIGAAVQNLGETGVQVAAQGMHLIAQAQRVENETNATNAITDFTRRSGDMWAEFGALRGQEATAAFPAFRTNLDALQQEVIGGAQNDPVRRALTRHLGMRTAEIQAGATRFFADQTRVAGVQATEGAAAVAINQANMYRDDPARMDAAVGEGQAQIRRRAELEGWDASTLGAKLAEYNGKAYGTIITNLSATNPAAAASLFGRVRDQMDASTQARISEHLAPQVRRQESLSIVDGAIGATQSRGSVADRTFRAEGGAAANPLPGSTARNGGITDAAWSTYASRLGLTAAQRNTREGFDAVFSAYQADAQQQIGRPLTDAEQYAAWGLGIGGLRSFLNAGRDADALAVYRMAAGPERANRAFETNGDLMRPGMTVGQVLDKFAQRIGSPVQAQPVNWQQAYVDVAGRTAHDPQLQTAALSELARRHTLDNARLAGDRASLERQIETLRPALEAGRDLPIPEDEIRRLAATPEAADAVIYRLRVSQLGGQMFSAVQYASPQELGAMRDDLRGGTGPMSTTLRARLGIVAGEGGAVAPESAAFDQTARDHVARVLEERIEKRNDALKLDPAGFVAGEQTVREALQRAQSEQGPETMAAYVTATLAAQARLGVPDHEQRVLSKVASQQLAGRITRGDPATEDTAAVLRREATAYGQSWPRVFGDLVRDGGLPPEYRVLATIPSAVGQTDFQRMMSSLRQQGGADTLRRNAGERGRDYVRDNLDRALAPFRETVGAQASSGGQDLFAVVRSSVENLALYYAANGLDGSTAMQRATDRILNDRYDFEGTARVPKGTMPQVRNAQDIVVRGLGQSSLAVPPDMPGASEADKRATMLRLARNGQWVANESDSGLVLTWQGQNGARLPVRLADGSRVEFRYSNMPSETNPNQMTLGGVEELRGVLGPMLDAAGRAARGATDAIGRALPGITPEQEAAINAARGNRSGAAGASGAGIPPAPAPASPTAAPPTDPVGPPLLPGETSRDARGRQPQTGTRPRGRWTPPSAGQ